MDIITIIFGILGLFFALWLLYWIVMIIAGIVTAIVLGIESISNFFEEKRIEKAPKKYSETKSVSYTPSQIKSLMDSVDYGKHPIGSAGYEYNKRRQKEKK
jgi:hypothetical protein